MNLNIMNSNITNIIDANISNNTNTDNYCYIGNRITQNYNTDNYINQRLLSCTTDNNITDNCIIGTNITDKIIKNGE